MKPIHILLVEDNDGDILLTTEALNEGKIIFTIKVVKDGWEAMQLLHNKYPYQNEPGPDLVLLDLNMPKMNGIEVLKSIKQSDDLKHIPVIILSTSSFEKDILLCLENGANSFISKPLEPVAFLKKLMGIGQFNIKIVQKQFAG